MTTSACIAASDPGIAEPERPPAGQNLRNVALPLRLLLNRGLSLAIATVVGAYGRLPRRPGTVLVISESGETIGFHPGGPLDRAIRDLATETLATGQDRLERLEIDEDAASYIGISGGVSLDIHATRVQARDPVLARALRHLGSGETTVAVVGTRGISGSAVIGPNMSPGTSAGPNCHRHSSRTHGPCWEAAAWFAGPTAQTVKEAVPPSRSGCRAIRGKGPMRSPARPDGSVPRPPASPVAIPQPAWLLSVISLLAGHQTRRAPGAGDSGTGGSASGNGAISASGPTGATPATDTGWLVRHRTARSRAA